MGLYALVDPAGGVVNTIVWDGAEPFEPPAGLTLVDAAGARVAIGWTHGADGFAAPVQAPAPAPIGRTINSIAFMALFTPQQTAALWSADPLLMTGAIRVMLQGTANLDSPEAANLLSLAVAKGALTEAEKTRILAGTPPAAA